MTRARVVLVARWTGYLAAHAVVVTSLGAGVFYPGLYNLALFICGMGVLSSLLSIVPTSQARLTALANDERQARLDGKPAAVLPLGAFENALLGCWYAYHASWLLAAGFAVMGFFVSIAQQIVRAEQQRQLDVFVRERKQQEGKQLMAELGAEIRATAKASKKNVN